jgi:ribosomal protein S28E/S33
MLSQKTLASIASVLKVPAEALKAAIEAKEETEVKVKLKEGDKDVEKDADFTGIQTFTADELTTRDNNVKESVKGGYHTAGRELAIKEIKEKVGLDFEGKKIETLVEKFSEKVLKDAKINPDAKVTELQEQIKVLKENQTGSSGQVTQLQTELAAARRESKILASLPARNPAIPDEDYLLLIKNKIQVEVVDGKEIYKDAAGNAFRNKDASAMDLKGVLGEVFTKNPGWAAPKDPKDGRGGGNSNPGGAGSGGTPVKYSEAAAAWIGEGKSINSADFTLHIGKLKEANKDFEMDLTTPITATPPTS